MTICIHFSCYFDVTRFVDTNNLVFVGATLIDMTKESKAFYVWQLINTYGHEELTTCRDLMGIEVRKGKLVCPVPATQSPASSAMSITYTSSGLVAMIMSVILLQRL